ncbi:MAG TPA: discoidin domain-containing protein [Polyangia bacterium]
MLVGVAHPALANVLSQPYDATKCLGDDRDNNSFVRAGGKITNTSGTTKTIHCPIVKTTSGPSAADDRIEYVDIPVETTSGAVECSINVWRSFIGTPTDTINHQNRIAKYTSSRSSTGTLRITPGSSNPSGYWTANGSTASPQRWYYADLACTLPANAAVGGYRVSEFGSTQTGHQIHPVVSCGIDASNTMLWRYIDANPATQAWNGGHIMGQASGNFSKFAMRCAVPNNALIDFAVARATGAGHHLGCKLDSNDFSTFTWRATNGSSAWPSEVLRRFAEPIIAVPISESHILYCGQNQALGDGRLLSYRVRLQPARTWTVLASTGIGASNVKDNDPATRFTTNMNGAAGQSLTIDFGSARSFDQINMDSGTSSNDHARGFKVELSHDNQTWTEIYTGTGTGRFIQARLSEQYARYVRIVLTSGFGWWWSIHELNVYSIWDPI